MRCISDNYLFLSFVCIIISEELIVACLTARVGRIWPLPFPTSSYIESTFTRSWCCNIINIVISIRFFLSHSAYINIHPTEEAHSSCSSKPTNFPGSTWATYRTRLWSQRDTKKAKKRSYIGDTRYSHNNWFGIETTTKQLNKGNNPATTSWSLFVFWEVTRRRSITQGNQQYHQILLPITPPKNLACRQNIRGKWCSNNVVGA